jgi:carbonic anhydrase
VHADKDGNLAVIAVMFQEGAGNTLLTKLWEKMPNKAGEKSTLPTGLTVTQLLPKDRDYYASTDPSPRRRAVRACDGS